MRIVITCITLALVPCLFAGPAFPDEQSDTDAVERELRAEKNALEIYKRAYKRAWIAIKNSSLEHQVVKAKKAMEKAQEISLEFMRGSDCSHLGSNNILAAGYASVSACNEERANIKSTLEKIVDASIQGGMSREKERELFHTVYFSSTAYKSYLKAQVAYDRVLEERESLQRKMTSKFLNDEIKKLREKKLLDLKRKLEELIKKRKAEQPA